MTDRDHISTTIAIDHFDMMIATEAIHAADHATVLSHAVILARHPKGHHLIVIRGNSFTTAPISIGDIHPGLRLITVEEALRGNDTTHKWRILLVGIVYLEAALHIQAGTEMDTVPQVDTPNIPTGIVMASDLPHMTGIGRTVVSIVIKIAMNRVRARLGEGPRSTRQRFKLRWTRSSGDQLLVPSPSDLGRSCDVMEVTLPSERDLTVSVEVLLNGYPMESVVDSAAMVTLEIGFSSNRFRTCLYTFRNRC